ncbi:hypothetical protein QLX08_004418 [Tetragonisca angustula]|uniref:Uncharacterized protein n=1 Tax=Tetragonisca angustula TaxID=166442 RepID=A0AAW1A5P5_9HYME
MSADRAEKPAESLAVNDESVKREKRSACGVSAASGTAAWCFCDPLRPDQPDSLHGQPTVDVRDIGDVCV